MVKLGCQPLILSYPPSPLRLPRPELPPLPGPSASALPRGSGWARWVMANPVLYPDCTHPGCSAAQATSAERKERLCWWNTLALILVRLCFFLPLLVGGVACCWLVLPLTCACPCILHRHAASLCASLTPTGLLSPPARGVGFVAIGSILCNGKENIFCPTGVRESKVQLLSPMPHGSKELLALA